MKYPNQKKWRDANPKKVWAHVCLQSAIRRGLVTPLDCEECGADKAEGHHDDYDKPMAVRWLCRACHKAAHKRMRGAA